MTGVKGRPTVLLAESDASAPTPYLALPYLTLPVVKVRGREAQPSAPIWAPTYGIWAYPAQCLAYFVVLREGKSVRRNIIFTFSNLIISFQTCAIKNKIIGLSHPKVFCHAKTGQISLRPVLPQDPTGEFMILPDPLVGWERVNPFPTSHHLDVFGVSFPGAASSTWSL